MNAFSRCSSGSYRYLCNGEDTGIEETWRISETGGHRRIECKRQARPVGITIRVESTQSGYQFEHCSIHWQQDKNGKPLTLDADYEFKGESLQITRRGDGQTLQQEATATCIFSPLMRIYNGAVIRQLQAAGGVGRVLVPWIHDHRQQGRMLLPDYSQRRAEPVCEEFLRIDGSQIPCNKFHYSGGEYQADTPFWLDDHDIMLMYRWRQDRHTLWEVKLQDYQPPS